MSQPDRLRNHALACLRLESDCLQLAGDAPSPVARSHFACMARVWAAMAFSDPSVDADEKDSACVIAAN